MVPQPAGGRSALAAWAEHLRNPQLTASFAIGFCILFAFIGTFTLQLRARARADRLGSDEPRLHLFRVPAVDLHHLAGAGRAVQRMGARTSLWRGFGVAAAGLPLLIQPNLATVLIGLALVGIGTFLTQATATGFVSRAATGDRGSASGAAVVPNGLDKIDDVGEILADIAPEFSVRAIYS
ncbi:MAG: transporter, partial [Rhodospirillales bacterium]|nr:transporter [Rhodospirillales bacterium]